MSAVTFTRMYPEAIDPMPADKAALGFMPTPAFQYCEAMRVASSHGWYVFPPVDICLQWNGADVFYQSGESWLPLSYVELPGFAEYWDSNCPADYGSLAPPYLRALPSIGVVQVWSGWLMDATDGWSALVRPLVNVHRSTLFYCFEAAVEIDRFRPCPLFVNLQLRATNVAIALAREDPLFQVQAVRRECYDQSHLVREGFGTDGMSAEDWAGFRQTVRANRPDEAHRLGDYAVGVRRRSKA
jgi:hypothetical protein